MSRYLRRLMARTAGLSLHALQPAPPLRWSSPAADPLASNEAAEPQWAATPTPPTRGDSAQPQWAATPTAATTGDGAEGLGPPQTERSRGASVSTNTDPGTIAEESRNGRHRARRAFDDSLMQGDPAPVRSARISTFSENRAGSDTSQLVRAELTPVADKHDPEAAPGLRWPQAESAGEKQDTRRAPSERPSVVTLQPALAPRPEESFLPTSDRPPRAGSTADPYAGRASVVLAPPPSRAPEAPLPRAEIVIGRISVVIDSARPSTPALRAAPRPAAGSARPADSSIEGVHHFGLGQL